MRNDRWTSWGAEFDAEWRDEVDPPRAHAGGRASVDALLRDMTDLAHAVVECAIEPLRSLARSLPDVLAFERDEWQAGRGCPGRRGR